MLYDGLNDIFLSHLKDSILPVIRYSTDIDFLSTFAERWNDFYLAVSRICFVVLYLERAFVRLEGSNLPTVKHSAFQLFLHLIVLDPDLNRRLKNALFNFIEMGRQRKLVNWFVYIFFR